MDDFLRVATPLVAALLGGVLGGWLSDRRKSGAEKRARKERERALLTGMYAVRNHIGLRLQSFRLMRRTSELNGLRSALKYADQIVGRMPTESEGIMMAFVELVLKLDAVVARLEVSVSAPDLSFPAHLSHLDAELDELIAGTEQFDIVARSSLSFLSEDDLAKLVSNPEAIEAPGVDGPVDASADR